MVLKKATKYDDLIALLISVIFARYLGRDVLGLTIDLDHIFLSSLMVLLFIILFYYLTKVIISFSINIATKRLRN
ncbi:hypothetical protein [Bacillus suaedae]|uniref:Uncharacterized protein n=1 Tax=Halalkalibacter suaedae TaxID=2822140 RepID=A0A941ANL7_9BACI|nr:hypothetical protein [Bacillus suaedae]MBP3950951.1 hypothetical protein [Bacillus suaedae]